MGAVTRHRKPRAGFALSSLLAMAALSCTDVTLYGATGNPKAEVDRVEQTYAAPDMSAALEQARRIADASPDLPAKTLYLLDVSGKFFNAVEKHDSRAQF